MGVTVNNCVTKYTEILSSLPPELAQTIACTLCQFVEGIEVDCDCQTLTELSEFTVEGTSICVSFTDENDVVVTRCFDFSTLIDNGINDTDGTCLNAAWGTLTPVQKWQEIVDKICDCCETTTTTTTTTTTSTSTTTTTTTTLAPQNFNVWVASQAGNGGVAGVDVFYAIDLIANYDPTQPEPLGQSWTQLGVTSAIPDCPTTPINMGSISLNAGDLLYLQVRTGNDIFHINYDVVNICVTGGVPSLYTNSFFYGAPGTVNVYMMIRNPIETQPHV